MPYNILCLETREPMLEDDLPLVINNGAEAAAFAAALTRDTGVKHQPRYAKSETVDWRKREEKRMTDGTYTELPWMFQGWFQEHYNKDHFAHVADGMCGMIAYTESPKKGEQDIQTRIKPGRYLERYFPKLGQSGVRYLATEFAARFSELHLWFAATAADMEEVYTNGPASCMSHGRADYSCGPKHHPVHAYAAGDLQVAYLARKDDDGKPDMSTISARAVCWPEKKIYSRIYGDVTRLTRLLKDAGFVGGSLLGARLAAIKHQDAYVMPYVDNCSNAGKHRADEHFVIDGKGSIQVNLSSTSGIGGGPLCASCEQEVATQRIYNNHTSPMVIGRWCQACADEYGFLCESASNRYYAGDDFILVYPREERWSLYGVSRYGAWQCAETEEYWSPSTEPIWHNGNRYSAEGMRRLQAREAALAAAAQIDVSVEEKAVQS